MYVCACGWVGEWWVMVVGGCGGVSWEGRGRVGALGLETRKEGGASKQAGRPAEGGSSTTSLIAQPPWPAYSSLHYCHPHPLTSHNQLAGYDT